MANRLGGTIQQKLPLLAGVYPCSSSYSVTCAVGPIPSLSRAVKKWKIGGRAPRRLILGLGVSFWAQLMSMGGAVGGNSFIASARQKGAVEEVIFQSLIT
jgi:hypothetical protein